MLFLFFENLLTSVVGSLPTKFDKSVTTLLSYHQTTESATESIVATLST